MKKKTLITICLTLLFTIFLCACTSNQNKSSNTEDNINTGRQVLSYWYYIAALDGNVLKIYYFNDLENKWHYVDYMDFNLPKGFKSVFSVYEDGLGVLVDNKVFIYGCDSENDYEWIEGDIKPLSLPKGCDYIFGHMKGFVGVVNKNTIRFFIYDWKTEKWNDNKYKPLHIPEGYKDIFIGSALFSDVIGVTFDDTIKYYESSGKEWEETKLSPIDLPKGFGNVFVYKGNIAVVDGNKVRFYAYNDENNKREEIKEMLLTLD